MPSPDDDRAIAVIVPAYNAEATIGTSIWSALSQSEVAEVVVVDDASADGTVAAAQAADDGTGRLSVHRLDENGGPSRARNVAIERSSSPLIAILDSDDRFLPARFGPLLAEPDWDIIADNIVFATSHAAADEAAATTPIGTETAAEVVDFVAFVEGNVSRRGQRRRELGFLHPVMRRAFLDRHGIAYRETMRLGEDFDLYSRALLAGARFKLTRRPGYLALERGNSLSAVHSAADLNELAECDRRLLGERTIAPRQRIAVKRHMRSVRARYELRRFLDEKREHGLALSAVRLAGRPAVIPSVVSGVLRDKLSAARATFARSTIDRRRTTLVDVAPSARDR